MRKPPISLRLPDPLVEEIDRQAERWGVSRTEAIRRLLVEVLSARGNMAASVHPHQKPEPQLLGHTLDGINPKPAK